MIKWFITLTFLISFQAQAVANSCVAFDTVAAQKGATEGVLTLPPGNVGGLSEQKLMYRCDETGTRKAAGLFTCLQFTGCVYLRGGNCEATYLQGSVARVNPNTGEVIQNHGLSFSEISKSRKDQICADYKNEKTREDLNCLCRDVCKEGLPKELTMMALTRLGSSPNIISGNIGVGGGAQFGYAYRPLAESEVNRMMDGANGFFPAVYCSTLPERLLTDPKQAETQSKAKVEAEKSLGAKTVEFFEQIKSGGRAIEARDEKQAAIYFNEILELQKKEKISNCQSPFSAFGVQSGDDFLETVSTAYNPRFSTKTDAATATKEGRSPLFRDQMGGTMATYFTLIAEARGILSQPNTQSCYPQNPTARYRYSEADDLKLGVPLQRKMTK